MTGDSTELTRSMLLPTFLLSRKGSEFDRLCLISHSTDETNNQAFETMAEGVVLNKSFYSKINGINFRVMRRSPCSGKDLEPV